MAGSIKESAFSFAPILWLAILLNGSIGTIKILYLLNSQVCLLDFLQLFALCG